MIGNWQRWRRGVWLGAARAQALWHGLAVLWLTSGALAQQADAEGDPELAALQTEFTQAVAQQRESLDRMYLTALESLETELAAAGDFAAAARVKGVRESMTQREVERLAGVEVREPADGAVMLLPEAAELTALEADTAGLRQWLGASRARWRFAPVPEGGYRVVVLGKATRDGELRLRVEEPFYFLEGSRKVKAGETFSWDVGYLRLRRAAQDLQFSLEPGGAEPVIQRVELLSPR